VTIGRAIGQWIRAGIEVGFAAGFGSQERQLKKSSLCSERDHSEAGDGLEVFHVDRGDIEAKMQGCGPDDQVFDSDGDSLGCLFSLDASGKLGDCERDRMHDHVAGQLVGEGFAAYFVGVRFGPVDAVRQLDDADGGEGAFRVAVGGANALDNLLDGLPAAFPCDEDAGVEDQSQGVSPMPTYRGACGCG
jgi:hypothetical protein